MRPGLILDNVDNFSSGSTRIQLPCGVIPKARALTGGPRACPEPPRSGARRRVEWGSPTNQASALGDPSFRLKNGCSRDDSNI